MIRLLAITSIIILASCADEVQAFDKALQINPENCLNQSEHCDVEIKFSWTLNQAMSFCVLQLGLNTPVFCIKDSQTGSKAVPLDISKTVEFVLIDSKTGARVDTSMFRVFTNTVQKRKRKRHAWSIL